MASILQLSGWSSGYMLAPYSRDPKFEPPACRHLFLPIFDLNIFHET